jgi:hypothetical protein
MSNQENQSIGDATARKAALDARLEGIGWGVLLVTIGTIWLLPEKHIPQGSWLITAGLILVGLNAIRYFNGIRMSGFSLVLGTLALLAGAGKLFARDVPLFAVALIAIGVCMLLMPLLENAPHYPIRRRCCCGWPGDEGNTARR